MCALLLISGCAARSAERGRAAGNSPLKTNTNVRAQVTHAPAHVPQAVVANERSNVVASDSVLPNAHEASQSSVCREGMQHIKVNFCDNMQRRCAHKAYDAPNRITICERFAEEQACEGERTPLEYCIDEFEYPNQRGSKPLTMVNFYEAAGHCAQAGKRLCYESEWVAACEGQKERPFPYGFARSKDNCNIDNRWLAPNLQRLYSADKSVSRAELSRLDQSQASGERPGCVSDYAVFDLTGNVDEWTLADRDRKRRSGFSALKGGAWGHVRNACRPVTTSHVPAFRYYFIGFRCCADATR
jgi:hypothetical protein